MQQDMHKKKLIKENEEKTLLEASEQQRKEWVRRNKIYEYISPSTSSTSSAGGDRKVLSYNTIIDTIWLYPISDVEWALDEISSRITPISFNRINDRIIFNNISDLYQLVDSFYNRTTVTANDINTSLGNLDNGQGYSLAVNTKLKDENKSLHLELIGGLKILTNQLVKQLTSQSQLPSGGNSPDGTIGYIVKHCDWDENGQQDPTNLNPGTLGFPNGDPLRIEIGPYISSRT